jgi:hypothetical protein
MFGIEKIVTETQFLGSIIQSMTNLLGTISENISASIVKLKDITTLLIKIHTNQVTASARISALETTLRADRESDRRFMLSIVALLRSNTPQKVTLNPTTFDDLFAEVPVGHKDGQTLEELGLDDPQKATQQDT